MRSMHSSEKIEELVTELEGYRWDAILLSETWRHEPAETMGDTSQPHFHGCWESTRTNTELESC